MATPSRTPHPAVTVAAGLAVAVVAVFALRFSGFRSGASDRAAENATPASDATLSQESGDTTAFSRPLNATAAVADSRGAGVAEARALGAADSPFGALAETAADGVLTLPTQTNAVPAVEWWRQIETLAAFGHAEKARLEFSLLVEQHPAFTPPEDAAASTLRTLGLHTGSDN